MTFGASTLRRWSTALSLSLSLLLSRIDCASADDAAPLPAKDVRWSATLGGAADVGSLPRAATGLALGFDVRRGALAARALTSVFAPQTEPTTSASVMLLDVMAMICALAPVSSWFDAGACGGGGLGLLRAALPAGDAASSQVSLRPEGVATARFDVALSSALFVSLETGTVLDPLRTVLPLAGPGDSDRASLFAFRGVVGFHVRVW